MILQCISIKNLICIQASETLKAGKKYKIRFHTRIYGESATPVVYVTNVAGETLHSAEGDSAGSLHDSLWSTVGLSFVASGSERRIVFLNRGEGGDSLFDHAFLVSEEDFQSCRQTVQLISGKLAR